MNNKSMEKIISLAKRRGFVFAGSDIYGGLANAWDFGPLGVAMKNNIKRRWWNRFVERRSDVVGIETALLMNTKVWEASGHLKEFSDPLIECKKCHARFREEDIEGVCKECGHKEFTSAKQFNLMLKTTLGPVEDEKNTVYFRPETAQGMFVNFKNVLETTRKKMPLGIAQIGKAFRNEITPKNFIFRTREFEQMEIEYFINPPQNDKEWQDIFVMWQEMMREWVRDLGIKDDEIKEKEIEGDELAHYSKRTVDFEYEFPFGLKELYGLAYRTDFDLKNHSQASGVDLVCMNDKGEKIIPHVIEPTWGVERSVLASLISAYTEEKISEEDSRVVLKLPIWLAPVKVAVLPLSKKEELSQKANEIFEDLLKADFGAVEFDETQSIGKRYRRQDEIGTPYCVTVDFDSLEDGAVTVRERDTMTQERVEIKKLEDYLRKKIDNK